MSNETERMPNFAPPPPVARDLVVRIDVGDLSDARAWLESPDNPTNEQVVERVVKMIALSERDDDGNAIRDAAEGIEATDYANVHRIEVCPGDMADIRLWLDAADDDRDQDILAKLAHTVALTQRAMDGDESGGAAVSEAELALRDAAVDYVEALDKWKPLKEQNKELGLE